MLIPKHDFNPPFNTYYQTMIVQLLNKEYLMKPGNPRDVFPRGIWLPCFSLGQPRTILTDQCLYSQGSHTHKLGPFQLPKHLDRGDVSGTPRFTLHRVSLRSGTDDRDHRLVVQVEATQEAPREEQDWRSCHYHDRFR